MIFANFVVIRNWFWNGNF